MDLESIVKNLFRLGSISSVNEKEGKARVRFEDQDDFVTKEYFLMFKTTKGNQEYHIPEIDEEVLCLCLPNGLEEGFILGSYYNKDNPPPIQDKDTRMLKFKDGSFIEFKDGVLSIENFKDIFIDTDNLNFETFNMSTSNSVDIKAPHTKIHGDLSITGDVLIDGDLTVNKNIYYKGEIIRID